MLSTRVLNDSIDATSCLSLLSLYIKVCIAFASPAAAAAERRARRASFPNSFPRLPRVREKSHQKLTSPSLVALKDCQTSQAHIDIYLYVVDLQSLSREIPSDFQPILIYNY